MFVVQQRFDLFGEGGVDPVPAQRKISVVGRQYPDAVQVIRKEDPGVDGEGMFALNRQNRFPKDTPSFGVIEQQPAPIGDDGEEKGAARYVSTAVVGHDSVVCVESVGCSWLMVGTAACPPSATRLYYIRSNLFGFISNHF